MRFAELITMFGGTKVDICIETANRNKKNHTENDMRPAYGTPPPPRYRFRILMPPISEIFIFFVTLHGHRRRGWLMGITCGQKVGLSC